MIARALLLVGSPRGKRSTSFALGSYLADRLSEKGVKVDTVILVNAVRSEEGRQKLLSAADDADLVVLAFPLYIDSLPASATRALELVHEHRKAVTKPQSFAVIVNNGFPDPSHNLMAADICRKFAADSGMGWAGSIRVSMGGAIDGRPLREAGGMVKGLARGLEMASASLAEGKLIPQEAEALASKPFMPLFLARLMMTAMGGRMWDSMAKANGALGRMWDRPYLP
jgi:hypothetical protein